MSDEQIQREIESLMSRGKTLRLKGETEAAVTNYKAADKLFAQQHDERGRTRCWVAIGKTYFKAKDTAKASAAFSQAATLATQADWPDKVIEAYYNKGLILEQAGTKSASLEQISQAIEAFEGGLEVARRCGDQASAGVLLLSLGFDCAWAKRDSEAIIYFKEAVPFALDNVDFDTAFSALSSLGVLLSNNGRPSEAIPYYEQALELAKSSQGDIVAVADTFANLGVAYEKAGRLEEAIEAIDTYREILNQAGDVKASNAAAMVKRLKDKARQQK